MRVHLLLLLLVKLVSGVEMENELLEATKDGSAHFLRQKATQCDVTFKLSLVQFRMEKQLMCECNT